MILMGWLFLCVALSGVNAGGASADPAGASSDGSALGLLPRPLRSLERPVVHEVEKWRPTLRRCVARGRRRACDSRRAPVSTGDARLRRDALGLGDLRAAAEAIRTKPRPEWVEALKRMGVQAPLYPLVWPVDDGRFGRGVGQGRRRFQVHRGVDVSAEVGTPVRVLADGMVVYADNGVPGYGNFLVVVHGGGQVSSYAHLSEVLVPAGEIVAAGDVVARSGNTGISRGPHLHFEWREAGRPADPMRRMEHEHLPEWMLGYFENHPLRSRSAKD